MEQIEYIEINTWYTTAIIILLAIMIVFNVWVFLELYLRYIRQPRPKRNLGKSKKANYEEQIDKAIEFGESIPKKKTRKPKATPEEQFQEVITSLQEPKPTNNNPKTRIAFKRPSLPKREPKVEAWMSELETNENTKTD